MSTKSGENDMEGRLGVQFEADNARADLERWRRASDSERARAIAELIEHAETIAAATGIRNPAPAPRLPIGAEQTTPEDDGA